MKYNDPPNLEVIDEAIRQLQNEWQTYSCCALYSAVTRVEKTASFKRRMFWKEQYTAHVFRDRKDPGWAPFWWNFPEPWPRNNNKAHAARAARIRALKSFRQACIDAAQKE